MVWTNDGNSGVTLSMAPSLPPEQSGGLNEMDLTILGRRECRVCVPIVSRYDLRVVAEQLRSLATTLDFESRRGDTPERASLFRVQYEIGRANRIIRDHYRDVYERLQMLPPSQGGRPKSSE